MKAKFPNFLNKAEELRNKKPEEFAKEDWVELICRDCEFYHEEEEEQLECAAFKMMRELIKSGVLSLESAVQEFKK